MSDTAQTTTPQEPATEAPAPIRWKRNPDTGLIEGLHYHRDSRGKIDWKAMIDPKHIVFNRKISDKQQAEIVRIYGDVPDKLVYAEVIKKQPVADQHVVIMLQGFLDVMELRGYDSGEPKITPISEGMVSATCRIHWAPNEEEPNGKTSWGEADATMDNTGGFGYLTAIAGNRSLVRAVRRGLNIISMGFDEIAKKGEGIPESTGTTVTEATTVSGPKSIPVSTLIKAADDAKASFADVKEAASVKWRDKIESDPATWTQFDDVPARDCLQLTKMIRDTISAAKEPAKKTKKAA